MRDAGLIPLPLQLGVFGGSVVGTGLLVVPQTRVDAHVASGQSTFGKGEVTRWRSAFWHQKPFPSFFRSDRQERKMAKG